MTVKEAKLLAYKYIFIQNDSKVEDPNRPLIIDDITEKYKYGWLFYYNGKKFIETGDTNSCYIGNAPIFIDKFDHSFKYFNHLFGPVEEQIDNYYRVKYRKKKEEE